MSTDTLFAMLLAAFALGIECRIWAVSKRLF